MTQPEVSKVTVNLPDVDVEKLGKIAKRHRSNRTTALVRAIRTTAYIEEEAEKGSKFIVRDPDGSEREVVFQ